MAPTSVVDVIDHLPGRDLIEQGLSDLAAGACKIQTVADAERIHQFMQALGR